ncbi:MAG TPA: nucleotide kinase domain-containing protein [Candidatus Dormibacteraeota bacterium]|nr:nucleotide kinase domain-containing protein [Candidatus Dormibacteraeota bacterium]
MTSARVDVLARRRPPTPSAVYDAYWQFAARRQNVFHRRVRGEPAPWTTDPVLVAHRFTNAYRASDRVSQYLIRHVAYEGDQVPEEVVFRVLLFKLFNRISTWQLLSDALGPLRADSFDVDRCDRVLSAAIEQGERLYSAAYIMPAASRSSPRKHRTHLELVRSMLRDALPQQLTSAHSMDDAFRLLLSYSGIGPFLAYQFVTDLNYSAILDFSEMDFVVAGPGARSGLRKCFTDTGDYDDEDLIRLVAERQVDEFAAHGLDFEDLWGRPLQLIDCQNLFCEVDKYARVAHPEAEGIGQRTRIKQRFQALAAPLSMWFPPKWGLNDRLPGAEALS